MSEQSTLEKLRAILVQQLGVDPEQIIPEARLTEDLGADSIDRAELVMSIEEEWNLEIDDAKAATIATVGKAIDLISECCE